MPISIPMDAWTRIRPRIAQWEATTGRKITPQALRAMMEAELSVAADRANQTSQLALQKEQLALQKEQLSKESTAAMVGGIANIGVAGAQLYLLNKYLNKTPGTVPAISGPVAAVSAADKAALASTAAVDPATGVTTMGYGGMTKGAAITPNVLPTAIASEVGGMLIGGDKGIIGKGEKTQAWGRVGAATATGAAIGGPVGAGVGFVVGVLDNFIHGDFGDLFG